MEFEWDEAKNQINQLKHGVSFEEATIRIISSRKATATEKASYERSVGQ